MSPQSRSLLTLIVFGTGAVIVLAMMAGRYNKILEHRGAVAPASGPTHQAVEGFIRVRHELRRAVDPEGDGPPGRADRSLLPELLQLRARALDGAGLAREDYFEVRRAFSDWRQNRLARGKPFQASLERRRGELERLDLGPYESLGL